MKIDDLKKTLKNRPNIPSHSKLSNESINFLTEYLHLLENYNNNGHKFLLLSKEEKLNSPEKRLRRSGTRLSDDELNVTRKQETSCHKKNSALNSKERSPVMLASQSLTFNMAVSEKIMPEDFMDSCNESSSKKNNHTNRNSTHSREVSVDLQESPIKYISEKAFRQKESFIESLDTSSNNIENSPPNVFSFKTKAFADSSDDEKSSINLSSFNANKSSEDDFEEAGEESPDKEDRRCFSDSASNIRNGNDFFNEKYILLILNCFFRF